MARAAELRRRELHPGFERFGIGKLRVAPQGIILIQRLRVIMIVAVCGTAAGDNDFANTRTHTCIKNVPGAQDVHGIFKFPVRFSTRGDDCRQVHDRVYVVLFHDALEPV